MSEVMDIAPVVVWAAGITTLLNLANMLWTIFSGPTRKLADRLGKAEAKLDEQGRSLDRHAAQIMAFQQTINAMPGHTDLHQLQLTLVSVRGELGTIRAVMEGNAEIMKRLETVVSRHEDHLLDGGKR